MDWLLKYRYFLYIALLSGVFIWYVTATPAPTEQGFVSDATISVERTFNDTHGLDLGDIASSTGLVSDLPNLPKLTWETVYITSHKPDEHIDLEYPKFSGGPEVESLNSYIEQTVNTHLAHDSDPVLLTPTDDDPGVYEESSITDIASRYRVTGVRNGVVSLELVITSYTGGGNGNHDEPILINWDLRKAQTLTDADLLCPGKTREALISAAKEALLTPNSTGRTPGEDSWVNSQRGVSFDSETNYFLLPTSGLVLVFPPYSVASGASGIVRVRLSERSVKNILCVP